MSSRLRMEVPAAPAAVPSARGAVTRLCEHLGIEGELTERIRLATTEACSNCVRHAYREGDAGSTLALEARVEHDTFVLVVRDYGQGITAGRPSRPGSLRLGLRMIEELADSSSISSRPGRGTRVAMRFAMASAE
jgi:anti-sigma regulatory factor (Ser/Thr protein kinase)